jgi:BirA family biotin operon repressor/biotin-[acetyl-CoA-carboxylase] ligase
VLRQDSLERAVRAAGIDVPPVFLDETDSTNTVALQVAEEGAPEWTVVAAGHQRSGRGRMGRSWASAPGRSLLFSIVLRPVLPPDRTSLVSLLAAVAAIEACGVPDLLSKWPNDLVVAGRKVGGILGEGRVRGTDLEHVVVGMGLNVSMREEDFPEDLRGSATSLAAVGGERDPAELLTAILSGFREEYELQDDRFAVRVVGRYLSRCDTVGREVRATTTEGVTVEGLAVGMDPRGGLRVRTSTGPVVVAFGEIAHLDRPVRGVDRR